MSDNPEKWEVRIADNEWLREELYRAAMKRSVFDDMVFPPLSRWARLKLWVDAHLPRIHLGPCDHSECE